MTSEIVKKREESQIIKSKEKKESLGVNVALKEKFS